MAGGSWSGIRMVRTSVVSRRSLTSAAVVVGVLGSTTSPPPAMARREAAASSCVALHSRGLGPVFRKAMQELEGRGGRKVPLPRRVLFGRCGRTYYAAAYFFMPATGDTDQPMQFSRRIGRRWHFNGGTGDPVLLSVPRSLRRKWGLP